MKLKFLFQILLTLAPIAQTQTPWKLEAFLQYYGHERNTGLGAFVKGFVGSQPNNPYNVAVAENYNRRRLLFYNISVPQDSTPHWIIPNGCNVEYGDLNGDGLTDLVVRKCVDVIKYYQYDTVLVYLGNVAGIDTVPTVKLPAEQEQSHFGGCLCVGDLNNDSIDDLVVTAESFYTQLGQEANGKIYIYFGRPVLNPTPDITITGSYHGARLGAKCIIGDFNDDGYNDLAVRGYDVTVPQSFFGYLNIYFGSAQLDTIADLTSIKTGQGAATSGGLAAFDVNGDKKIDLLWTYDDPDTYARSVFIHYGGSDFQQRFETSPDFIIHSPPGAGEFGNDICNGGDMNGDGANEIVIAAYATGQENGIVFVFTAGQALDDQFDAARGQSLQGNFGNSIDHVGDINQDGYSDIIIGAPRQPWGRDEGYFGIFQGDSRIPTHVIKNNLNRIPSKFLLHPAYPNPLNTQTNLEFSLSHPAKIELTIFNILGKEVLNLVQAELTPGQYQIPWDGKDQQGELVSNGIYFVRMRARGLDHNNPIFEQTQKLAVIK